MDYVRGAISKMLAKTYKTKIKKDSKGLYITLPKELLKRMNWKTGDVIEWNIQGKDIIYLIKK